MSLVKFEQRDTGESIWVNPDEVQSVEEYGRYPVASLIRMRTKGVHVVRGSTQEVVKQLDLSSTSDGKEEQK